MHLDFFRILEVSRRTDIFGGLVCRANKVGFYGFYSFFIVINANLNLGFDAVKMVGVYYYKQGSFGHALLLYFRILTYKFNCSF